jgi:STE24 endopeptidase
MNEDKATHYQRLKRRASVASTILSATLLVALLVSGISVRLREIVAEAVGGGFILTISGYVVVLALLSEALQLPMAYYRGVTLERRFGLSTQHRRQWWSDRFRSSTVIFVLGFAAVLLLWSLLRWVPVYWWLVGAACTSVLLIVFAYLAPVLLLPLFYDCRPLQHSELSARLVALAERAGTRVLGVFEWRLGDRTRKANAALTGLGRTRRILLSDTLLLEHSNDEVEVVVAHELGHHVHHDIGGGIALETALLGTGFYLTDRALTALSDTLGLTGKDDVAALPLLLLFTGFVSLVLLPVSNAVSRAYERRADQYALAMTRNPVAFVTAMRRLGDRNLSEPYPSKFAQLFFCTHPPVSARITAAQCWTPPES